MALDEPLVLTQEKPVINHSGIQKSIANFSWVARQIR
jgi:hypothetical protein